MKSSTILALALCSGIACAASAQTPAPPAKIAVVAFQQAVAQTNEFQRSLADVEKKFSPKRDQLKALNDEISGLKKQLETQGTTLSESERAARTRTIDDKQKELQRSAEEAQNEFQQAMQETYGTVASKVGTELIAYSKAQGFTLVLDGGQQQTPIVLYAVPSTDITQALVDAYNVKSGIPAPPAQPASAAPKPAAAKPATHAPSSH